MKVKPNGNFSLYERRQHPSHYARIDKDLLQAFADKGLSMKQVAENCEVSGEFIRKKARKLGVVLVGMERRATPPRKEPIEPINPSAPPRPSAAAYRLAPFDPEVRRIIEEWEAKFGQKSGGRSPQVA